MGRSMQSNTGVLLLFKKGVRAASGLLVCFCALAVFGAPEAPKSTPASRANDTYRETRRRYESVPTNAEAAWQFARACFDQGEFATNDDVRASVSNEGIAACRQLILREPQMAAAHYYLAMDLGELARTKLIGALPLLAEMETEWKKAQALDENFDFAGPDRNLGSLYLEAPGWPASIGSKREARQHLMRAVQLDPGYPENGLNLLGAYIKWHDSDGIEREYKRLLKLLPEARKQLVGDEWESSWTDWDARWEKFQTKLQRKFKPEESQDKR
jgi:tetratricopeptide (TPR) repeat protein